MKVLVVLLLATALGSSAMADSVLEKAKKLEAQQAFVKNAAKECSEETGANHDNAMKLLFGDFSQSDEKSKCFLRCIFTKKGYFNEAGEVQREFVIDNAANSAVVSRQTFTDVIDKCIKIKGPNACENAFKFLECYMTDDLIKKASQ